MNGIKISKEDWLKMSQLKRDGAMFDFMEDIRSLFLTNIRRMYIIGGAVVGIVLAAHPEWAKFLIGKAVAAF